MNESPDQHTGRRRTDVAWAVIVVGLYLTAILGLLFGLEERSVGGLLVLLVGAMGLSDRRKRNDEA